MSRLRKYERWYQSAFKALSLLAGIVFTRGLETSPVDLAYILAGGIIAIGVVLVLRRRAKHRRLLKQIGALAGRATTWVTELGADFSLGAGLGILLAAGIENWGGWVAFVVFFALAVEMISVGALFKQIDRDEKGIEIPSGASVPQETVEQLIDRVDSGFSALKVLSLWIWATALFAPAVLAFFLAVILSGDLSSHSGVITTADIALLTLIVVR